VRARELSGDLELIRPFVEHSLAILGTLTFTQLRKSDGVCLGMESQVFRHPLAVFLKIHKLRGNFREGFVRDARVVPVPPGDWCQ